MKYLFRFHSTFRVIVVCQGRGPAGKIICMTNPTHGVLNVSGRQCQTSTDYLDPSRVANSGLVFLKELGSSSGVTPSLVRLHRHVWWADASRKRLSYGEFTPSAHGVNPPYDKQTKKTCIIVLNKQFIGISLTWK